MLIIFGRQKSRASLVAQTVKSLPAVQETQVQSLGWEDNLEKEQTTHCSILAWKISWTEEPGGLQSMGSQKTEHGRDVWQLSPLTVASMTGELYYFNSLFYFNLTSHMQLLAITGHCEAGGFTLGKAAQNLISPTGKRRAELTSPSQVPTMAKPFQSRRFLLRATAFL